MILKKIMNSIGGAFNCLLSKSNHIAYYIVDVLLLYVCIYNNNSTYDDVYMMIDD